MPFRIAIDASRSVAEQPTGTEYYSRRMIQALILANELDQSRIEYSLYQRDRVPPELFKDSAAAKLATLSFPRLWTHLRFAAELWRSKPDLTFVPAHTLPLLFPGNAVVTVHDLGFKYFPAAHPIRQRAYLDMSTRFSQARASLVFADSQATARDLSRFYDTKAEKIRVIYPGVDAAGVETSTDRVAAAREKHNLPRRYFLFIGTLQPRKNIERIVQAFASWQARHEDWETALVFAGGQGWLFDPAWLEGARQVRQLGYIDETDKAALLRGALALVYPSLYEGFGFPAVEAMIAGTPVIASNTSSLAEIVGDNGLSVDPRSIGAISQAMSRISADETLRRELIGRGYQRAKRFTWELAAEQAISAFRELGAPA